MPTLSPRAACPIAALAVVAALGAARGKKKDDAGSKPARVMDAAPAPSPVQVHDAAPAPVIDAAQALNSAFTMPTDAKVVPEAAAKRADATALGAEVTVNLVDKVAAPTGDDTRHVDQVLVLRGTGALIVELGFAMDESARYADQGEELRTVEPIDPPRPFTKDDASAKLAFTGPLAYVKHWRADPDTRDDLAVGRDGDVLIVWRSQTLDGEAGDWFEQARVTLAPGAKVVWK